MKKIAILVDSFIGVDEKKLAKKKFDFIPHSIYIDDKKYYDGINIAKEKINEAIINKQNLKTSQPSVGEFEKKFKELSNTYNDIIYLPIGNAISGTSNVAKIVAKKYKNIYIVENNISGEFEYYKIAKMIRKLYSEGKSTKDICTFIKKWNEQVVCLIIPENLDCLLKSGRVGKKLHFIFKKIKIAPILQYEKSIKLRGIKRTHNRAILKAIQIISDNINKAKKKFDISLGWSTTKEKLKFIKKNIEKIIKVKKSDIHSFQASAITIAHLGIGAISISISPKFS